jgi:hypothetical protein
MLIFIFEFIHILAWTFGGDVQAVTCLLGGILS